MLHSRRWLVPAAIVLVLALAFPGLRGLAPPRAPLHVSFGRGSTVVLVHGLGSASEHWLPMARALARRHRVVLVELPGHGTSEMPQPFSLERAVESLDAALAAESHGPVVLVGHSVGGLVAAAEALDHPGRVRGLVLVETALKPQVEGADREAMLAALDHGYQPLLRAVYTAFGRDSAQGAALYAEAAAQDSTSMKRWIRLALTADLSARASALEAPVLAVLAARTWPDSESWTDEARELGLERVGRIQPLRLQGCGHFVMIDRPRDLASAIERFIERIDVELIAAR